MESVEFRWRLINWKDLDQGQKALVCIKEDGGFTRNFYSEY